MIKVEREPDDFCRKWGIPETFEQCCFCRRPTRFWYTKKDVAVCPDCAATHKASEVPTKDQWWDATIAQTRRT